MLNILYSTLMASHKLTHYWLVVPVVFPPQPAHIYACIRIRLLLLSEGPK